MPPFASTTQVGLIQVLGPGPVHLRGHREMSVSFFQYLFARYFVQAIQSDGKNYGLLTKLSAAPAVCLISLLLWWMPVRLIMNITGINQRLVDLCKTYYPSLGEMAPSIIVTQGLVFAYLILVLIPKAESIRRKYVCYREPATLPFILLVLSASLGSLILVFVCASHPYAAAILWVCLLTTITICFRLFLSKARLAAC